MSADYPAAHSMDISWYAVDAVGHVALFESGQDGHVPVGADDAYHLETLFQASRPAPDPDDYEESAVLAERFGFFLYEYGDSFDPIVVYRRRVVPPNPVHVDQLPPAIRDACKQLRLPVAFAAAECMQPIEFFECHYWNGEEGAAYVAADGVTVRPMKGREAHFAEFVRRFRAEYPEEAARYRFEGVDDGA
jgi:hypothetical protein